MGGRSSPAGFDEFEDASLMRQKIAALFSAFVTDVDGSGVTLGAPGKDSVDKGPIETLEPGLISYLKPGQEVVFSNPPVTVDGHFSAQTLRRIASRAT